MIVDLQEISQRFAWYIPKINAWDMPGKCQRFVWDMPEICLRFALDLLGIRLIYSWCCCIRTLRVTEWKNGNTNFQVRAPAENRWMDNMIFTSPYSMELMSVCRRIWKVMQLVQGLCFVQKNLRCKRIWARKEWQKCWWKVARIRMSWGNERYQRNLRSTANICSFT